jgi:predicted dehydrogenase
MNIAIVGTGYVAEMYAKTFGQHPELNLIGAYDRNPNKLAAFCRRWSTRSYTSFEELLRDASVDTVLNLTNPRSHFEITFKALDAGKHVYSEKPLAMDSREASKLVALAEERGVYLASAPCSLLSETAQTVWKAINEGTVGKVRLVYANFDGGMIAPNMAPWTWLNEWGVPWPAKDEFEVGCTYIHAGYLLTWLAAFFGPAKSVTSFSSCQIPDKGIPVHGMAPDFSVGCIEYGNGIVARVTCGLVAPEDKSLTIIGDDGIIYTSTVRNDVGPVYVRHIPPRGRWWGIERRLNPVYQWLQTRLPFALGDQEDWHVKWKYPFARRPNIGSRVNREVHAPRPFGALVSDDRPVDFNRGPAELAEAIRQKRPCRLSAKLGLHVVEIVEALQYPERFDNKRLIVSKFDPIQPLPWSA